MKIINSFSAGMLASYPVSVLFSEVTLDEARRIAAEGVESAVGHADTAAIFAGLLGTEVAMNRASLSLKAGDKALLGQYAGPRLPEGSTTLPEGATIRWLVVEIRG